MKKSVLLASAFALAASAALAGGVKDEKLTFVEAAPPVVPSSLPIFAAGSPLLLGGLAVVVIGAVLAANGT